MLSQPPKLMLTRGTATIMAMAMCLLPTTLVTMATTAATTPTTIMATGEERKETLMLKQALRLMLTLGTVTTMAMDTFMVTMAIMGTDTMVTTPTVIMDTGAGSRTRDPQTMPLIL